MGAPRTFTADEDAVIGEMRAAKASWRAIGQRLGRSHYGCQRHWVDQLQHQPGRAQAPTPPKQPAPAGRILRGALDAGDPISWGAITVGTLLEGRPYR